MLDLALKPTFVDSTDDFAVYWTSEQFGRQRVGRVYLDGGSGTPAWAFFVNSPLPSGVPAWCNGRAPTLDEAKADFRRKFEKLVAQTSDDDWRRCFDHQSAVAGRWD